MRRARARSILLLGAVAVAFIVVEACTGEDPAVVPPSNGEGGVPGNPPGTPPVTPPPGTPPPGNPPPPPPSDGGDAGMPYDAGPPIWNATFPSGTQSNLSQGGTTSCTFVFVTIQTAVAPPKWELFLQKIDAPAATCNQPKGIRALGSAYSQPHASVLHSALGDHLAVAFSAKQSLSGSAPEVLTLTQVDEWSGNDMHVAIMKTKAVVGMPSNPSLTLTQVFFGDPTEEAAGTVRLTGMGSFPGATGSGTSFEATYVGFLSDVGQLASAADSCTMM